MDSNSSFNPIPLWRLELLGGFRARRLNAVEEAPIERFRTQKTASLLAFLAYQRGAHRRESLCELFWPQTEPENARNSLRVALTALRTLLEPEGVPAGAVLQVARDTVALTSRLETDVALFRDALKQAKQAQEVTPRRAALETAVALYRGPLLRGLPDEWMIGEEAQLENLFIAALLQLTPLLEAEGQRACALDVARRALSASPLREETIREVLRLGLQNGQASQVAREWEGWQKRALKEGVSVSEATLELARSARQSLVSNLGSKGAESTVLEVIPTSSMAPRGRSLPPQWTKFFGRARDIATLQEWLGQPSTQLVTITGPGGGGKTRLALEIACTYARELGQASFGAVEWLSLANLPQAQLLPGAILELLQAAPNDGSLPTLVAALRQHLGGDGNGARNARFLLVLDNFEHLCDEGAPLIHDLLAAVPELVCLVTSRRRLSFGGEREWPLQPLETPALELSGENRGAQDEIFLPDASRFKELSALASVQLFLDRAHLVQPGFHLDASNIEIVARLCAYLDGLPLALELAAARVALFSPSQILAGVNRQMEKAASERGEPAASAPLDWVNSDRAAPARHHSLRAAIAWSERQLPRSAAQFWSRLSTFRGGWTLEAAAFVCEEREAAPLVLALRDVSLLSLDTRGEAPRGHQLEALREYAAEGLSEVERNHIAARHARYFLNWALTVTPQLNGARAGHILSCLEAERENLRAALSWHLQHDVEGALRLAVALYWSWQLQGRVEEGHDALLRALEAARQAFPHLETEVEVAKAVPEDRRRLHLIAGGHNAAGKLATLTSDFEAARVHLEAALQIFRLLNEELSLADCLYSLGYLHLKSGDLDQARVLCDESVAIYRHSDDINSLCDALYNRALVALYEGDFATVRALNNQRLAMHRAAGEKRGVAISLETLGLAELFSGEVEAARTYFTESLSIFEKLEEWHSVTRVLWGLGQVARAAGQRPSAQQAFFRALQLARESQTLWTLPYLLESLSYLVCDWLNLGETSDQAAARAARLLGAASLLRETHDEPLPSPMFRQQLEVAITTLRAHLGQAHYESQWQLGRTLSLNGMIVFALETLP